MTVTKLRFANEPGLAPAGVYFQRLTEQLRAANAREAALQADLDAEDRKLEKRYRAKRKAPVRRHDVQLAHAAH
jgi:hypothetical protein